MTSPIHVSLLAQKAKSIFGDGLQCCEEELPARAACSALNELCLGKEKAWFRRVGDWWKEAAFVRRLSPNCEFPTPSLDDIFSQAILASARQLKKVLDVDAGASEERRIQEHLLAEVRRSLESGTTWPAPTCDSRLLPPLEAALREEDPETQLAHTALLAQVRAALTGDAPGTPSSRSRLFTALKKALKRHQLKTAADHAYHDLLRDPQGLEKMGDLVAEATFMMCLKSANNLAWSVLLACLRPPGTLANLEARIPAYLGDRIRQAFEGQPLVTPQLGKVYEGWADKAGWPFLVIGDLAAKLKSAEYFAPKEEAKKQANATPLTEMPDLVDPAPTPDKALQNRELQEQALACAAKLRPVQKAVWEMRHLQQLTNAEIAREMEARFGHPFTPQKIATSLHEANTEVRRRIRRLLGDGTTA